MYEAPGIGLAAVQIGILKRLVVIDISKDKEKKDPLFLINPLKVTLFEFILISTAALFINSAMFFATTAFKIAQKHYASVFSLVYLQVLWSSLVGIFIFNEYMNLYAYIGAIFIVLSGIVSLPSQIKQLKEAN